MLETAHLVAHAAHLHAPSERRAAWNMVTKNAASVLDVEHGIVEGKPATLNVFPQEVSTPTEAICQQLFPRVVIHEGSIVAETNISKKIRLNN